MVKGSSFVAVWILLLLLWQHGVKGNCPLYGCTPSHSFTSEAGIFTSTFKPKLQWRFEHPELKPTGAGCVTNAAKVVCPMSGENGTTMLISWDTVNDGKSSWNVSLKEQVTLPIVDISGSLIASDGSDLVGYSSDGTPFGKPIHMFPTNGQLFDLTITLGQYVILLYKCGFFPVYFTNGIPHASVWLNDTVEGINGTFIPLDNPATNNRGRLYILTVFRPFESSTKYSPSANPYIRLYAIEVRGTALERIKIIWYHDMKLSRASIPYVLSESTLCKTVPPHEYSTYKKRQLTEGVSESVGSVLVQNNTVVVVFNFYHSNESCKYSSASYSKLCKPKNDSIQSQLFTLADHGENCTLLYSKQLPYEFSSMAYLGVPRYYDQHLFRNPGTADNSVWISMYDGSERRNSILLRMVLSTGDIAKEIDVSKLLGVSDARITTKISMISKRNTKTTRDIPMVFGATSSSKNYVTAVDIATTLRDDDIKCLWTLSFSGQSIGQISTVDGAKVSLLIITDEFGVNAYKLANVSS